MEILGCFRVIQRVFTARLCLRSMGLCYLLSSAKYICMYSKLCSSNLSAAILWLIFTCTNDTHGFEFTVQIDGSPAPSKRVAGGSRGGSDHLEELSKVAL